MKNYKTIFFFALLALVGCSGNAVRQPSAADNSPTGVLRKYVEASQKNDVETLKQTLSSGTMRMFEESARKQNMTLEESLARNSGSPAARQMPEMRNENIEGDTATVEVKNGATPDYDKIPLVKENGQWKIAFDKFFNDLERKRKQELGIPETGMTPATSGVKTNSIVDSPAANRKS